jgi:perosamine synthetase
MYPPINKQKVYNYSENFMISNIVGEKGLWLPSASQLSNDEILKITKTIEKFYKE